MKYVDYGWDLSKDGIVFDDRLDIAALGWKENDYFIVKRVDGNNMLIKVDQLTQFIKGGEDV
jgi:hypothetical protein